MGIKVSQTRYGLQQEDASKSFYSLTIFIKGVAELFAKLLGHKKIETFHRVKKVQTILIYHRGEEGNLPPYSDLF